LPLDLPIVVSPGTTKAWVTPRPAEIPRRLVILGGFVVDDGRTRRLHQHARRLGFPDLRGYLQARCDAGYSVPRLASELGVSEWTISQALAAQRVTLPSRREHLARQRRRFAQERIAARVVELGFADVRAYLQDRLLRREWLLADVAAELGVGFRGAAGPPTQGGDGGPAVLPGTGTATRYSPPTGGRCTSWSTRTPCRCWTSTDGT
jgi:hypothetical protein